MILCQQKKEEARSFLLFIVDFRAEGTSDVRPEYYPGSDIDEKYHSLINHLHLLAVEVFLKMVCLRSDIYFHFHTSFSSNVFLSSYVFSS